MESQYRHTQSPIAGGAGADSDNEVFTDNGVPKIIHLFWAGVKLPNQEKENLFSFHRFLPKGWEINFWVTNPDILSDVILASPARAASCLRTICM